MLASSTPTILLVEDDLHLRQAVAEWLELSNYQIVAVEDGVQAFQEFEARRPSLVVLDLLLPEVDGWEVCRQLRARSNVPIIVTTALSDEASQIRALDMGADDYLAKPFSMRVLLARVRALLRRAGVGGSPVLFGPVRLDPETHAVTVEGRTVALTPR
jgi:DNA-binding response OmpR family regulator